MNIFWTGFEHWNLNLIFGQNFFKNLKYPNFNKPPRKVRPPSKISGYITANKNVGQLF